MKSLKNKARMDAIIVFISKDIESIESILNFGIKTYYKCKDEYIYYYRKAEQIRTAIRQKYIKNGHVNITTQTALVLAIYFKILNENEVEKILIFLKK